LTELCDKCGSNRLLEVSSKCSDRCYLTTYQVDYCGYVPDDIGIGGGDYIYFEYCLECGKIQGEFPLNPSGTLRVINEKREG